MDKQILKKIAKRWCKAIIESNEAAISFMDAGLDMDEIDYIQKECYNIAERITKEDSVPTVEDLVKEYYDFQ